MEKEQRLGLLGIGIMCPSVYPRTIVSVSYHYKNLTKPVGLVQSGNELLVMI
jgi:hypothetical protein